MWLVDTNTRNIREIARALLREIDARGHICLHSEDWGTIKADVATVKEEITTVKGDVKAIKATVDQIRGERKAVAAIMGFIGAVIGGIISMFVRPS